MKQLIKGLYHLELNYLSDEEDETDADRNENQTPINEESHSRTDLLSCSLSSDQSTDRDTGVHANLTPLIAALESKDAYYLIYPYLRFTLFDAAMHSPAMFEDSVAKPLFVIFQLLKLLDHCHRKGITLGELSLKNVFVDSRLWVQVRLPPSVMCESRHQAEKPKGDETNQSILDSHAGSTHPPEPLEPEVTGTDATPTASTLPPGGLSQEVRADSAATLTESSSSDEDEESRSRSSTSTIARPALSKLAAEYVPPALHLSDAVHKWRRGELSNFDYLMVLNYHAGRCLGDPNNHPIFPWVMDFTHRNGGFRDLSKSKHRLNKGDRQLDFCYMSAQEEMRRVPDQDLAVPHHIGDISSDVTYYVYMARRTPREVLCMRVRPRWVPEEYPTSIEKMYMWTPDECIPEFFVDSTLFKSIHPDMADLEIPTWCSSPEELISIHRNVLESDIVSSQLHHWIDLVFGYKLWGDAAVRAKNVYLSLVDKHKNPTNYGIVQLFRSAHPKRIQTSSAPLALFEWQSYLSMSSVMNVTTFRIGQGARNVGTATSTHPQTPDSRNPKTLESILNRQANMHRQMLQQAGSPKSDTDGNMADMLEDDSSYEHIALPDELKERPAGTIQTGIPNGNIGIEYGDISDLKSQKQREGAVLNTVPAPPNRFRVPVVNYIFRQRKGASTDVAPESYDWQNADVAMPRDSNVLHPLSRLEDLANFVSKSCRDHGSLFQEQWKPEDLLLFKVRVT